VQALKIGEIDFLVGLSSNSINALEGTEGVDAHLGDSPGFDEIAFNTGRSTSTPASRSATLTRCSRPGVPACHRARGRH
jgi:hypothetical protein